MGLSALVTVSPFWQRVDTACVVAPLQAKNTFKDLKCNEQRFHQSNNYTSLWLLYNLKLKEMLKMILRLLLHEPGFCQQHCVLPPNRQNIPRRDKADIDTSDGSNATKVFICSICN